MGVMPVGEIHLRSVEFLKMTKANIRTCRVLKLKRILGASRQYHELSNLCNENIGHLLILPLKKTKTAESVAICEHQLNTVPK